MADLGAVREGWPAVACPGQGALQVAVSAGVREGWPAVAPVRVVALRAAVLADVPEGWPEAPEAVRAGWLEAAARAVPAGCLQAVQEAPARVPVRAASVAVRAAASPMAAAVREGLAAGVRHRARVAAAVSAAMPPQGAVSPLPVMAQAFNAARTAGSRMCTMRAEGSMCITA